MAEPWLSVVLPTHDGERHLAAALESVARQADPAVEVVAVDDGSRDGTVPLLEAWARRTELHLHRLEGGAGWVASTNVGLRLGRGRFACLLHQDDLWEVGRLAAVREALSAHPDAGLVLHGAWFVDEAGRRVGRTRCPLPALPAVLGEEVVTPALLVQNFVPLPAPVFRLDLALGGSGLDESLWYAADWDLWLRLARLTPALNLPEALCSVRLHRASQTLSRPGDVGEQLLAVLERHWVALPPRLATPRLRRLALFSASLDAALFRAYRGKPGGLFRLVAPLLRLGPRGVRDYLRLSRISERAGARLRARVWP